MSRNETTRIEKRPASHSVNHHAVSHYSVHLIGLFLEPVSDNHPLSDLFDVHP